MLKYDRGERIPRTLLSDQATKLTYQIEIVTNFLSILGYGIMAVPDTYSYYFGLGIAIVLGYVLSSLRIERLLIAAIMALPERISGTSLKKQISPAGNNVIENEQTFPMPSVLSGRTEENIFELERRAIFSKAGDFNIRGMETSDTARPGF